MNFTVQSIESTKEFQSKFGPMISYTLTVNGPEGMPLQVDLNQKADTSSPHVGQVIWGHIEETEYGPKLKKDPLPQPTAPSPAKAPTAPQTSSPAGGYRQQDPEVQKSIIKQSMLKAAVDFAIAKSARDEKYDLSGKHVLQIATYFVAFSEGRVNVTMTPEEVAVEFGYEKPAIEEDEPLPDEPAFDEMPREENQ